MIQGGFKMKIFCKLVCLLGVLFYLGCKQEESPQNTDQPPGGAAEDPAQAPPVPEEVPTVNTIAIPAVPQAAPSPTVNPGAAPPSVAREEGLKIIEFVDRESQHKFIGLEQRLPTGQIVLLMLDNTRAWISRVLGRDIGAMVNAAKDLIVEIASYDKRLVDFICEQETNSARLSAFIQGALKFSGGATLALINPEDGSAQTYMGSAMEKPSDFNNHIVIRVLIRDQLIQRVVMVDLKNADRRLSYLNRAVNPNEDVPEHFAEVDLVRYLTVLERIKGPNLDFPVCNPQTAAPQQPAQQSVQPGDDSSDTASPSSDG